ncbi:MAG: hypothetical protein ABIE03_00255 [Patescibacteria group bacterium]|nr:hypothetical protein [Patescibacteria group bacterium]
MEDLLDLDPQARQTIQEQWRALSEQPLGPAEMDQRVLAELAAQGIESAKVIIEQTGVGLPLIPRLLQEYNSSLLFASAMNQDPSRVQALEALLSAQPDLAQLARATLNSLAPGIQSFGPLDGGYTIRLGQEAISLQGWELITRIEQLGKIDFTIENIHITHEGPDWRSVSSLFAVQAVLHLFKEVDKFLTDDTRNILYIPTVLRPDDALWSNGHAYAYNFKALQHWVSFYATWKAIEVYTTPDDLRAKSGEGKRILVLDESDYNFPLSPVEALEDRTKPTSDWKSAVYRILDFSAVMRSLKIIFPVRLFRRFRGTWVFDPPNEVEPPETMVF